MKKSVLLFVVFSLVTCFFIAGCCSNNDAEKNKAKACAATMRVLLGAVEMYNMDNMTTMMRKLNDSNFKILVSKGYIKNDFKCECPETDKFQYSSTCDLVDAVDILTALKCENHGTIKDIEEFLKK